MTDCGTLLPIPGSCRAQKLYRDYVIANNAMLRTLLIKNNLADILMNRCLAYAFKAIFKSRANLVTENLSRANY